MHELCSYDPDRETYSCKKWVEEEEQINKSLPLFLENGVGDPQRVMKMGINFESCPIKLAGESTSILRMLFGLPFFDELKAKWTE